MVRNLGAAIKSILKSGEENAISRNELAIYFDEDERIIRKTIERLRRSGTVIASSHHGYFYPATTAELSTYIRREERRARQINSVLSSAREELNKMQ